MPGSRRDVHPNVADPIAAVEEVQRRPDNRGPSAAAGNRAALVAAAREVFAEQGIDAPLRAVARRAGVGQGSLYRHFSDRVSLALAAFEENVAALEQLAADPGSSLEDCFALLLEQVLTEAAFIPMLVGLEDTRIAAVSRRVELVLAGKLPEAQRAGRVRPEVVPEDCFVALSMMGALVSQVAAAERREVAEHAWRVLQRSFTR